MKQVAEFGLNKALTTFSIVTFFAAGCFSDGATLYAQERKAPTATTAAAAAADSDAMELPGVFKVTPETAQQITQKSSRPANVKRNSADQFIADAGKVTGSRARRTAKPAPAKSASVKPEALLAASPRGNKDANKDANKDGKRAAKKIRIPAQLANPQFANAKPGEGKPLATGDFQATAYSLKGRTASGEMVRTGLIAADPRVLPLGTMVRIEAGKYSGVYKVADTGGAIKGNKIDIYVPTYREAKLFGRQKIKVTVLGKEKKSR